MMQIDASPDELLAVVKEMFPIEYERAAAELTIRKLVAENQRLTVELASRATPADVDGSAPPALTPVAEAESAA